MNKILFTLLFAFGIFTSAMSQTDRGFIHPGGLHTQADFDRVRSQIASGNAKVTEAYNKLLSAGYSQAGVTSAPVETIVRGGGVGENYINAARAATMAYQNALRWKLSDSKANANTAVSILMAWANTTKSIGGDSNYALASGLYGYQFAQAAELMRDYDGWSREDFAKFQRWMLDVWYPYAIGFLRGRNGTWENSGKWWQAPGHYWSNWGLCNALCVVSIGILCDDVFIYNQGMSYFKYDQVGTYTETRTDNPIKNDGLVEFLGNLVVTTYPYDGETGAYGVVGQMNESGRDVGHSAMALGLAVDLAKVGWNQGDDLFAYMDHRLAAGIEYIAAQTQSVSDLPWTDYQYGSSGYYYTDSRAYVMTEPALGAHIRPYWGTVIGIYEGVKGVKMPYSERAYAAMGIDEGGMGATSGGYDHLGYSVLMNTYDEQMCPPEKVATELSGKMEYSGSFTTSLIPSLTQERNRGLINGKIVSHNELGGLVNTYTKNTNTCLPSGQAVRLMPQLPEDESDTGNWKWNTGETTREITVDTDHSYIYRVTYTNSKGVESQLSFAIASSGDCTPAILTPSITIGSGTSAVTEETSTVEVLYGKSVTMSVASTDGWGTYTWDTGGTTNSLTKSVTADAEYTVEFKNQGGAVTSQTFHLHMLPALPYVEIGDGEQLSRTSVVKNEGETVTLGLTLPAIVRPANVSWSDGSTGATLTIDELSNSTTYTATFTLRGKEYTISFDVYVKSSDTTPIPNGHYVVMDAVSGKYLTCNGNGNIATFEPALWDIDNNPPTLSDFEGSAAPQLWYIDGNSTPKYDFCNEIGGETLKLTSTGKASTTAPHPFFITKAAGCDNIAIHSGLSISSSKYWAVDSDGSIITNASTSLLTFPFRLIPVGESTGISSLSVSDAGAEQIYDLSGSRIDRIMHRGVYIVNGKKVLK